jgi:DNA invertase Pin-like site-specific DNA recombinase
MWIPPSAKSCANEFVRVWLTPGRTAVGRPLTAGLEADKIRKLYRSGLSESAIARQLSISRTSVRRILAASHQKQ